MDEGIVATLSAAPKFIIPKIHYLSFKIHSFKKKNLLKFISTAP
jgi:hypothetical protein